MKYQIQALLISFSMATFFSSPAIAEGQHQHGGDNVLNASPLEKTDAALRDMWVGHAFWVRAVVTETLNGNKKAAESAEKQAVNNAKQLAASVEPFYGKAASDDLFKLLAGHYTGVKKYLLATRSKNSVNQEEARNEMFSNAEQIAVFLSSANPNLPKDAVKGMLMAHGGHHVMQIQQLADKQYEKEAQTWEEMKNHMYGIADALTVAIATQFPSKF
jgi:hypothetical protein